ncbi:type I-E CRISPR-associated protein Cse1/CasA [Oceanispirochaeta sp. M2]|nr:type I-E CRISPR-associated protein Cse1/CasA [Oceanispirochaeta sp. M2]
MPYSRFVLIADEGIHYSEGIAHDRHNEGVWDPSVTVKPDDKTPKAIWVSHEKKSWRSIPSLLSFMQKEEDFLCYQLKLAYQRIKTTFDDIGIWTGGIMVSSNAGEQYCSGTDDYSDSSFSLNSEILGEPWYFRLRNEMQELNRLDKAIYSCMNSYHKELKVKNENLIKKAKYDYWSRCERNFQDLLDFCEDREQLLVLRKKFASYVYQSYDKYCPSVTARQMAAWAKCKPKLSKYLSELKEDGEDVAG